MANKRIFVAFAIEDVDVKILSTGQAKNKNVSYQCGYFGVYFSSFMNI